MIADLHEALIPGYNGLAEVRTHLDPMKCRMDPQPHMCVREEPRRLGTL